MLVRRSTLFLVRYSGTLSQQHGHPILTLTLPSRNQPVAFTCKPVTGTVGSLINDIVREDGGVTDCDILTEVSLLVAYFFINLEPLYNLSL